MAATQCQQNTTFFNGGHNLPHQKVLGLAPAYFLTLQPMIQYGEYT